MSRKTISIGFFGSILVGLVLQRLNIESLLFILPTIVLLVAGAKPVKILSIAVLLGLGLGMMRADGTIHNLEAYDQHIDQEVEIRGVISDDPSFGRYNQTEFHISDVEIDGDDYIGRVRIATFDARGLRRGDSVVASGRLREGYGNRQGSISYASVSKVSSASSWLESIRRGYFASIYSNISDPQASLGLGFLVGLRSALPDELIEQLSRTGLTHIVAVSGYNLTILIMLCRRLLARYSKYLAVAGSITFIATFMTITGSSPSIVRASIVAGLSLLVWYFGRRIDPLHLLIASAAISAMISPLYLWLDLGWWLSFTAFYGVLILKPAVEARFFRKPLKFLPAIMLETTCAQIAVLPLIMWTFGDVSVISVLANAIVLPLIPITMMLTFVGGGIGLLLPAMGGWASWPAQQILNLITELIATLSQYEYALVSITISRTTMITLYAILVLTTVILRKIAPRPIHSPLMLYYEQIDQDTGDDKWQDTQNGQRLSGKKLVTTPSAVPSSRA